MRLLTFLLAITLLAACGETASDAELATAEAQKTAQDKAYAAMMEAHDRVMPMMGRITATQKAIVDELATEGLTEERRESLKAANDQLEAAGDGMMEWMADAKTLEELRTDMKNDAIITYIKEKAESIAAVETEMITAITTGEELIGAHNHDGHDHGDHDHDHDHGDHDHKH